MRSALAALLAVAVPLLAPTPALGDEPPRPGVAPASPAAQAAASPPTGPAPTAAAPAATPSTTPPPTAPPSLDFDLLDDTRLVPLPDPALEAAVERRRLMLKLHQGFGMATYAAVVATTVVGQLNFDDRFRGGGDTGKYRGWHRGLAWSSAALFTVTGGLALFAPEPYEKRTAAGIDTARLHKLSMAVAAAGMVAQVALGVAARNSAGSLSERDLAAAHQVVGYVTLGAMTAGVVVLAF